MTEETKNNDKTESEKKETKDGGDGRRAGASVAIAALVVALSGIGIGIGGASVYHAVHPRNPTAPETAARAWGEKLRLPYRGAACTMFDTDDDGYVSCVVALDGADQVYFQGLQCGEEGSRRAGGCKVDVKNPQTKLVVAIGVDGVALQPRPGQ